MTAIDNPETTAPAGEVYRAFWRWHFYAGLLVLPILMLMALTGGLYLFKDELTALVHRPLVVVAEGPGQTKPTTWIAAAEAATRGEARQVVLPARYDRSVQVTVEANGEKQTAYVDPHTGAVLGTTQPGGVMGLVKHLHSLEIAGPVMNLMVEVAAGWTIVLVATGIFLWWPRGQAGGVVTVRSRPAKRLFWRDLHAVTGVFASGVILFLAVTGMPWSAFWGKEVRQLTTQAGWGRPKPPVAEQHHGKPAPVEEATGVPWALQAKAPPPSEAQAQMAGMNDHDHHMMMMEPPAPLDANAIVARARAGGLTDGFTLSLPKTPAGTWTAAYMPDKVEQTRTVYLDGGDGHVLADIGYRDFGPAAQAIEWGIAVHQGQQFGLVNKLVMLAGCVAIWLMGVSAIVMWWKRRPKGRLAAPARPTHRGAYAGLLAIVLPLALLYPLVGASLVAALLFDLTLRRLITPRAQTGA
ncbi:MULTISPECIES: PepSY domain-containing protein [unclassified Caulobacter]|uniref:PepSY-associated TM helix domain-containing protein n=1 Tax=unclassified Caulobacter TaxID=2648921 RepID=UPI000784D00D|nr:MULTISPECIES: PepSY domain-containing protein [unclassified Caulobacter]AZS19623.1 PepSY domain-containing protein [Caulobacter sp. FWC26]